MKRVITVGLVIVVLGLFFIWKVQQNGWTLHRQSTADFILSEFGSTAVVKVQPYMPPVLELGDGKRLAVTPVERTGLEKDSVMEIYMEEPPLDEGEVIPLLGPLASELPDTFEGGREGPSVEMTEEAVCKEYDQHTLDAIFHAEKKADSQALKVLQIGREMSLEKKEIVQGGCWNYVDTVYSRAGYSGGKREVIFQGGPEEKLYASKELIRPGDWLFYINHDYREARHSAIFVDWIDYEKQIGLMLSYGGEGRGEPARYSVYDLGQVYNIVRPLKE